MRILHVLVSEEQRRATLETLEDLDVEYVVLEEREDDRYLVEIPLPAGAVGVVRDALDEAGVDDEYIVLSAGEAAITETMETLYDRYADEYDPISRAELRSKARDLNWEERSFFAMMLLSAVIATAGLLSDSPAVVVGSMVVAPIVGPAVAASVGAVTGDRDMVLNGLRLQAIGIGLAVVASAFFSFFLKTVYAAPPVLDVGSIELIGVRLAPNLLTLMIGIAAGAAAAIGLTTKGSTSIVGVMIAAALIPSAAAAGIAIAWYHPLIAVGTIALLVTTLVAINLTITAVLAVLGYRPETRLLPDPDSRKRAITTIAVVAVLALVVLGTGVATAAQIGFEESVNREVHEEVDQRHDLEVVNVQSEYRDFSPFTPTETITVVVSTTEREAHPDLARELEDRVVDSVDREVTVRVRFIEYQESYPEDEVPDFSEMSVESQMEMPSSGFGASPSGFSAIPSGFGASPSGSSTNPAG